MDERHYYPRRAFEQEPPQRQYNEAPLDFTHTPRPTEPRQRYRATQYEHPMYDEVEDDDHGSNEQLDAFDEYVLQQPLYDRQQQASQGLARLSFAPASSRTDQGRMVDTDQFHPQMQQAYHQTYRERDRYFDIDEAIPRYMGRHAYHPNQFKDSSSDIPYNASSSPALNASRRQATQYLPRQAPQLQVLPDRLSGSSNLRDDEYQQHPRKNKLQLTVSQRDSERLHQQRVKLEPTGETNSLIRATPVIQGIPLVPVSALPDRVRTVFPYPTFNAVQSKCFEQVYRSDNNFVLSSPTGSGKTAILELAICRAVATNSTDQYKVVYQAPTKALCAERQRDWDKKFTQLGLRCAELTGDSDASDLRNVQSANIIITTPEKWDSMTRKWKDHERLMRLVKLFLVDEVHILNENRGAVLEAVVSRMKSIGTEVRFVALSATVPNLCDVAAWLGKNSSETYLSSPNEKFGEEFRPVKLKKHVCGYMSKSNNDWAFEKQLDDKLPSVIAKYSERKPMMIFCATRKSCIATAKLIANWWKTRNGQDNLWKPPSKPLAVQDKEVRDLVAYGVAFHHAGLGHEDRSKVEAGFLQGDISVICCTSTLAVGVNLPCHLVIVKNTISWTQEGFHEYSDLEMMQMLGRAGRPQFDSSAVAVIMTRQNKVRRYETLVTGQEILESRLHLNLIDHMNAEIGLGTIRDLDSARTWLTGTFLYVRLLQNPTYYKLEGSRSGQSIREQVDDICFRDLNLLKEHNLAVGEERFRSTEFGHTMARYYVQFETMKVFMGIQPKSALSEVLSAVAQAVEFSTIRFRQGEKSLYKMINQSPSIRFPIPVNLDLPAQKVSIIIQSVLGHAEISWDGDTAKHRATYTQEVATIFKSINSLIRCIIDCQIVLGDSVTIHNALMLERSLGSRAWDDSPMQMIQIPEIGNVSVRKLVNAGIRGIEDLEATEARRIETILGKSPPFGLKILDTLKSFPKLRVSLSIQQTSTAKTQEGVKIQVSADIGFMNQRPPERFANKLVYVCMLAETSDGRKVHFTRISGHKLGVGQKLVFPALLTSADQTINCYLMCEGIAGSMRYASITPKIVPSLFPLQNIAAEPTTLHKPNMSRRRIENVPMQRKPSAANTSDNYDDADLDDEALVQATCEELSFDHIDNYANPVGTTAGANFGKDKSIKIAGPTESASAAVEAGDNAPTQLPNGKWLCNHNCKDKKTCKHYCCKHGMDRPPKKAAPKRTTASSHQEQPCTKSATQVVDKTQTKLQPTALKRKKSTAVEELDLTQQEKKRKTEYAISGPHDFRALHKLHKSVQKTEVPSSLHSVMHKTPQYRYGGSGEHQLSCLSQSYATRRKSSSEYGDLDIDGFVSDHSAANDDPLYGDATTSFHFSPGAPVTTGGSETFGDDDSMFGDAMVGLADSQDLRMSGALNSSAMQDASANNALNMDDFLADIELPDIPTNPDVPEDAPAVQAHNKHQEKPHHYPTPFLEATSSPEALRYTRPATPAPQRKGTRNPPQSTHNPAPPQPASSDEPDDTDVYSDLLSLLDTPPTPNKEKISTKQTGPISPARPQPTTTNENSAEQEPKEIPDAFKDLQPWLFQQFGDVVELVSE